MVISSIIILAGLGFVAAAVLAVASKIFYVEEDPRVEAVSEALPGANCGGCGYAGCDGYAVAVVNNPVIAANLCVAGGSEISIKIGELTGKVVTAAEPLQTFRRCNKLEGRVEKRFKYQGMHSCAAASTLGLGEERCAFACLGYGDCVEICPFEALRIEDGIVKVNENLCIGCGKCVNVCPRCILELTPKRARVVIVCSTQDKLRAVMDVCQVGCIQCGKCVKTCPAKAITPGCGGRMVIDHIKCLSYGPDCNEACIAACARKILRPKHAIVTPVEAEEASDAPKQEAPAKAVTTPAEKPAEKVVDQAKEATPAEKTAEAVKEAPAQEADQTQEKQ